MKRVYSIIVMLLLLLVFVGCSNKYSTVYCDFDIGDFETKGYYQLKSKSEIEKFKETHQTSSSFGDKLKYDDKFFNDMYLIVLVMPAEESKVNYEIQHIKYSNSALDVHIKQLNKSPNGSNDGGNNNGSNNNDSNNNPTLGGNDNNNDSNDGSNDNGSNNNPTLGGNDNMPDNNNGSNNNPTIGGNDTMPDNNGNGGMDGSDSQGKDGTQNQNPSDGNNESKMLVNKAFILEMKKKHTVTKINLNII